MEKLLRAGGVDNLAEYNCSWKSPQEWAATGVRRPVLGWIFILFSVFYQVRLIPRGEALQCLYIPCLLVMMRPENLRFSAYKIMLFLGVLDVLSSFVTGQVWSSPKDNLETALWLLAHSG